MSDFNEGDLVEAVKGETVMRGRLVATGTTNRHVIELPYMPAAGTTFIEAYEDAGFTVTVIEKAAPPLPTTPGSYLGNDDRPWRLGADGYWHRLDGVRYLPDSAERFAPFIPLEPVPVTAARVLDDVIARTTMHCNTCSEHLADIRKEYGVTQ